MRVNFLFFHTVSNTRNMSVNISVDSLETLEETFFSWWGKTIFLFEALVCKKKKTDRKMHFINYYNNCIFPQVFYLNNKSSLNFLATCSKYVLFRIDLWKNHPNMLDFFAKAIFSQTLKVFLTERVRQICGGHS